MRRRYNTPKAKPGELLVKYGQEYGDCDVFYCWPENHAGMKRDSKILMRAFERIDVGDGRTLLKELEARGYDIATIKFSIMKKQGVE